MAERDLPTEARVLAVVSWGCSDRLAGRIRDLAAAADRIVVFDPIDDGAIRANPGAPGIRIDATPAASAGETLLRLFSLPGLRAVNQDTAELTMLYPGLRGTGTRPIRRLDPAGLAEAFGTGPGAVIVDVPGSELEVLAAFEAAGVLGRIDTLSVRSGAGVYFEDAADSAAVRAWLEDRGFRVTAVFAEDPDWPELQVTVDQAARQNKTLMARVAALEAEIEAGRVALDATRAEVAARTGERDQCGQALEQQQARVATLEAETEAGRVALEATRAEVAARTGERDQCGQALEQQQARVAALEAETEAGRVALEATRAEVAARTGERDQCSQALEQQQARVAALEAETEAGRVALEATRAEVAARTGERDQCDQALEQHRTRVAALEAEAEAGRAALEATRAEVAARTDERDQNAQALEQQRARVAALEAEAEAGRVALEATRAEVAARTGERDQCGQALEQQRGDLTVSLRLQAIAQTDLQELRQRLAEVQAVRTRQEALLRKLAPRLQEAAQHLQGLMALPGTAASSPQQQIVGTAEKTARKTQAKAAKAAAKAAGKPDRKAAKAKRRKT